MKKLFSVLLILTMVLAMLTFGATALAAGGFEVENGVLVGYTGQGGKITIPSTVKVIGEEVFKCNRDITSVTIPEGVTTVETRAFFQCSQLVTVNLPSSLRTIAEDGFGECYSLAEVNFSKGLKTIGDRAFEGQNYSLKKIVLPDTVTSIGVEAFSDCRVLETVKLPKKLTSLGEKAFAYCYSLAEISIPSGVTKIGDATFYQCYNLATLELTENIKSIGEDVFNECYQLTIEAPAGSYALKYAKKNGISYSAITKDAKSLSIAQGKSAKIYVGNTLKLEAKLKPTDSTSTVTWKSSNTKVAKVSKKGVVTPLKEGEAVITAATDNGLSKKITIKVVDARSVTLEEGEKAKLKVGEKLTLHAKVSPSKVVTDLKWKSSDTKVAKVSRKGVVTALKKGTAKITVTTANKLKATIKITVK